MYLKFLAIADSLVLLLFGIRESLRLFTFPFIVASNSIACSFTWFSLSTTTMSSPWLMVGLTVDRFFCVVFPLKRHMLCTRKKVEKGKIACFIESNVLPYFTFLRLFITSNIPCLLILIFNIVIGIYIQRSAIFRKRFTYASSGSTKDKIDNSLRPLLLISMLAFLTIMPLSVVESVIGIVLKPNVDPGIAETLLKLWLRLHIPYLVNCAQNFYILMASSVNFRNIIKSKLKSLTCSRRSETVRVSVSAVQINDRMSI